MCTRLITLALMLVTEMRIDRVAIFASSKLFFEERGHSEERAYQSALGVCQMAFKGL